MIRRNFFNLLGIVSFALGFAGAFLPILPTTPLILLASYFFSKGSPRFHRWLLELKFFGPMIRDWEHYGVISKKSKIFASSVLLIILILILISPRYILPIKILISFVFAGVTLFINTRPSRKQK